MSPRPLTENIPEHLLPYIAKQDASLYTPIDHASWRFILRVSREFFSKNAHQKYVDGLKETGISTERIPLIEEMDHCLRRFGWRAVAVSGFIPPAAFMEFQSLGILPIACEMRTLDHLAYTPAPDIVHEAAGHAPIIADPEYAEYLRNYGEVSRKAIFSNKDMGTYEAIRDLSVVKEDPTSTPVEVAASQSRLDAALASVDYISEANYLSRMNWWTVEYGLVGTLAEPKIYGAGLLSSVGESFNCLKPEVKKIPLSLSCLDVSYDITRPQPQLFVTPDFHTLTVILREFEKTMAFCVGGREALDKAKKAASLTTTVLDSGIQISGIHQDYITDSRGKISYLKYSGPTQLSFGDHEIADQGPKYHVEGFSTCVGVLVGIGKSPADLSEAELVGLKALHFESGITVQGDLKKYLRKNGKNLILSFENCTVKNGSEILFQPAWGTFDLACGENVISVFGGAADRSNYIFGTTGVLKLVSHPKTNATELNLELGALYLQVRMLRESGRERPNLASELSRIHETLEKKYSDDWLLRLELLELNKNFELHAGWEKTIEARLMEISANAEDRRNMITRGLRLIRSE